MAEHRRPDNVIYPAPPPIPEHIRRQLVQRFSSEDRRQEHRSNVSGSVSSNNVGVVENKISNGVNHSAAPKSRQTNGHLSDEETTSTLSELSSSDHESSLDGWDNYQNSVVGGSPENNQNGFDYSDNDQDSNIDGSNPDVSDQDSIEPYYDHDSPNENNTNGISPFTSSPHDKQSNITPKSPEPPPKPPDHNSKKNGCDYDSEEKEGEEEEERESSDDDDEKSIATADFEGSDNEFPSLAFIKSKIEETTKKKTEKWAILRDLQVKNSEEPEPELDSESGTKYENGISNGTSEKSSPPPKFEPLEVSLFKDEKEKTNILSSPVISNHERNDLRPFSNHTRNEPVPFSSHERSETGPFQNHSRSELNPFPVYFSNHDRYETFLYSNHDRNDLGRFSNHERSDSGRFSNHERSDSGISSFNRMDDDITAFHHQLPFGIKRLDSSPPPGPVYKRPRPMSNGIHYSESMNHSHSNSIYGPPPTGPSGMSGNGMMGRGRDDPYPYYHRNDYRPNAPPYIDRPGPYGGRGHMNSIPRRPSGPQPSRSLTRPPDRSRNRY